MKIKIVFTQPPYEAIRTEPQPKENEQVIFIRDPYKITMVDGGRLIENVNGNKITYEQYCIEIQKLIAKSIQDGHLEKNSVCSAITVVGFKEPPTFEVLHYELANHDLPLIDHCKITYKDCTFSGALYVNALKSFVNSINKSGKKLSFDISLDEAGKSKLSEHDKAKLAAITSIKFHIALGSASLIPRFTDNQFLGIKPPKVPEELRAIMGEFIPDLSNPTYFFRSQVGRRASPKTTLMNFFSQAHQQRSDYTCGPSALKMIADYYVSMANKTFCGQLIKASVWNDIDSKTG